MHFAGQFVTIHKKQYILRRGGDIWTWALLLSARISLHVSGVRNMSASFMKSFTPIVVEEQSGKSRSHVETMLT